MNQPQASGANGSQREQAVAQPRARWAEPARRSEQQRNQRNRRQKPARPADIWAAPADLPAVEPIVIPNGVDALVRSLGDGPSIGGSTVLDRYVVAVVERTAVIARAPGAQRRRPRRPGGFRPHSASLRSGEFVERLRRTQLSAAGQQAGLSPQARGLPPPPAPPTELYRGTPRDRITRSGELVDDEGEDGGRAGARRAARRPRSRSSRCGRCRRRGAPGRSGSVDVGAHTQRREQRRRPGGRRDVGRGGRTVDLERVDERQLADRGDVLGERADETRSAPRRHRHDRDRPRPTTVDHRVSTRDHRRRRSRSDTAPSASAGARRARRPTPGSSANASARPGSQPAILPLRPGSAARPQLARFDDDVEAAQVRPGGLDGRRGSGVRPGCGQLAGAHRAASARARGRGRRAPAGGTASGTRRRRRSGASGRPRPRAPARSAVPLRRVVAPTACRWRPSRPASRTTTPSTASILSSASSRPRRSRVAVSIAGTRRRAVGRAPSSTGVDVIAARECRRWRSTPRSARRLGAAAARRRRRRAPGRPGRPAGSRRPATTASRRGCRTPGRACRSPCRAPTWRRPP